MVEGKNNEKRIQKKEGNMRVSMAMAAVVSVLAAGMFLAAVPQETFAEETAQIIR